MKALKLEGVTVSEIDIDNTLETLQKEVEGYIECLTLVPQKVAMIVNEEGRLCGMAPNLVASAVAGVSIVGPAVVVGIDDEDFCDIPEEYARRIKLRWVR